MTAPTPYNRLTNFQSYQAVNPTSPLNGASVDGEYNRLKITTDSLIASLGLIQRSDGQLANGSVGPDQISSEVALGFKPPVQWTTATAYLVNQGVFFQSLFYISKVAHTSNVFATDLALGYWYLAADFTAPIASSGALVIANNLSDVASVAQSRSNLGIDAITYHGDSNATIAITDRFLSTNAALTAPRTWTLPLANTTTAGQTILIGDTFGGISSTNTLTVQRNGTDTINGQTAFIFGRAFQGAGFLSDGVSKWFTNQQPAASTIPRGLLAGCAIAPSGGAFTYTVAAGTAASDDNSVLMVLPASMQKTVSSTWSVGNAGGGLDTGLTTASTWYHVFVIRRPDTGAVDVVHSLSVTSPTMPAGYTQKRRIGSILTNASQQMTGYFQNGDDFVWVAPFTDLSSAVNGSAGPRSAVALTVPTGVKVDARFNGTALNSSVTCAVLFTSLDQNDIAVSNPNFSIAVNSLSLFYAGQFLIRTNTSAQIGVRSSAAGATAVVGIGTIGWVDTRGRFS
jgi:hypothetical protein